MERIGRPRSKEGIMDLVLRAGVGVVPSVKVFYRGDRRRQREVVAPRGGRGEAQGHP